MSTLKVSQETSFKTMERFNMVIGMTEKNQLGVYFIALNNYI